MLIPMPLSGSFGSGGRSSRGLGTRRRQLGNVGSPVTAALQQRHQAQGGGGAPLLSLQDEGTPPVEGDPGQIIGGTSTVTAGAGNDSIPVVNDVIDIPFVGDDDPLRNPDGTKYTGDEPLYTFEEKKSQDFGANQKLNRALAEAFNFTGDFGGGGFGDFFSGANASTQAAIDAFIANSVFQGGGNDPLAPKVAEPVVEPVAPVEPPPPPPVAPAGTGVGAGPGDFADPEPAGGFTGGPDPFSSTHLLPAQGINYPTSPPPPPGVPLPTFAPNLPSTGPIVGSPVPTPISPLQQLLQRQRGLR